MATSLFLDAFFSIIVFRHIIIASLRLDEAKECDDDAFPAFDARADDENDFFDSRRETDDTREEDTTEEKSVVRRRSICQREEEGLAQTRGDEKTVRRVSRRGESAVLQLHDETHRVGRRTRGGSRG